MRGIDPDTIDLCLGRLGGRVLSHDPPSSPWQAAYTGRQPDRDFELCQAASSAGQTARPEGPRAVDAAVLCDGSVRASNGRGRRGLGRNLVTRVKPSGTSARHNLYAGSFFSTCTPKLFLRGDVFDGIVCNFDFFFLSSTYVLYRVILVLVA